MARRAWTGVVAGRFWRGGQRAGNMPNKCEVYRLFTFTKPRHKGYASSGFRNVGWSCCRVVSDPTGRKQTRDAALLPSAQPGNEAVVLIRFVPEIAKGTRGHDLSREATGGKIETGAAWHGRVGHIGRIDHVCYGASASARANADAEDPDKLAGICTGL